jgi:hypothetical protein
MIEVDQDEQIRVTGSGRNARRGVSRPEYRYRAYGLALHSDLAVPELEPDDAEAADVTVRLGSIDRPMPEPPAGTRFEFGPDDQYLAWLMVGRFLIRDGREIVVEPLAEAGEALVRMPLLGPVMAVLLHLRGMLVLHASAVAIGGRSAIFLGDKQAGKSTTAAALVGAGHRLIADDVLAIQFPESDGPWIAPGFPHLKLDVDVAKAVIGDGAAALPPAHPSFEKRQHRLTEPFSHARVRPARIYVLSRDAVAASTPLAAADALTALIRFSYITRFGASAFKGEMAGAHLRQCAKLAGSVGVSRLDVPSGVERLGDVVRLVERDVA